MTTLNLLHDADLEDQKEKKKPQRPSAPAVTSPAAEKPLQENQKPSRSPLVWLRGLLGRFSAPAHAQPRILEQSKVTMRMPQGRTGTAPAPTAPPTAAPDGGDGVLAVNLMPNDLQGGLEGKNNLVRLAIVAVAALCLVALVYLGLSLYQTRVTSQAQSNQARIQQVEQRMSQLSAKQREAVAFHKSTLGVMNLLNRHLYWTKFFRGLEKYTVDSVAFHGVNADRSGRVTLTASAKSYRSVAEQLIAFQQAKDFVQTVSITSATAHEGPEGSTVDFSASLTLVDDVFYRSSDGTADYTLSTTAQ